MRGHRIATEILPGDAVPYVDRVLARVIEMVRQAGAVVVSSGELVSRFFAVWDAATRRHTGGRRRPSARSPLTRPGWGQRAHEARRDAHRFDVQGRIVDRITRAGTDDGHLAIAAIGLNAAESPRWASGGKLGRDKRGELPLIHSWAREAGHRFADQTWVGVLGTLDAKTTEAGGRAGRA